LSRTHRQSFLGAINRYIFPDQQRIFGSDAHIIAMIGRGELDFLFMPIIYHVVGRNRVMTLKAAADGPLGGVTPIALASLRGTKIELYNCIRRFPLAHTKYPGGIDNQVHPQPKSDLALIQAALDTRLGQWRGRVILKNKEDCPPCSACGKKGY
jgi:hypothetical protein